MITQLHCSVLPGGLLLARLLLTLPAEAQRGRQISRTPQELLEAFPYTLAPPGWNSSVSVDINHISVYPEDYPPADLEVFLRGIERLALTADSPDVRRRAAYYLARVGHRWPSLPVAPIYPRLLRIYHSTDDPWVRRAVARGMGHVAHRQAAAAFLEQIATQHPPPFPGAAEIAVSSLIVIGAEGRPVLRRLHQSGAVRDRRARGRLEYLAEHDFHYRPPPFRPQGRE